MKHFFSVAPKAKMVKDVEDLASMGVINHTKKQLMN
jgi:hypothetical protein